MMLLNLNRKQNPHKKASESTRPEFYDSGRFFMVKETNQAAGKKTQKELKKCIFLLFLAENAKKRIGKGLTKG